MPVTLGYKADRSIQLERKPLPSCKEQMCMFQYLLIQKQGVSSSTTIRSNDKSRADSYIKSTWSGISVITRQEKLVIIR
jgi:hypothetical protein